MYRTVSFWKSLFFFMLAGACVVASSAMLPDVERLPKLWLAITSFMFGATAWLLVAAGLFCTAVLELDQQLIATGHRYFIRRA